MDNMAESSGLQVRDTFLKTLLKQGFELTRELETQLDFAQGPDFTNFIYDYLDRIVITFSSVRGLIYLNSSASNFERTENRSSCPRSPSPPPMGYGSSSNVFGRSVSRNWPRIAEQKCHELAEGREDECFSRDKERAISTKRKRVFSWLVLRMCSNGGEVFWFNYRRFAPTSARNVPANGSEAGKDIPPEDGYTWRKYGQKEILGDDHPKMYYKCTFHDDRGCNAKKTAQRSNGNPSVIQVRYCEVHSCKRDAQFFKIPLPISEIEGTDANPNSITPTTRVFGTDSNLQSSNSSVGNFGKSPSNWLFTTDDGGKSPSYSPYVDSSAQRAMGLTGHSADQMYRFQGSEKEVSDDFIPSPQQNEEPSNCQASLPPCGLSSASEANYMPPTNPGMQTSDFWLEYVELYETDSSFAELLGTDLSSASYANDLIDC